MKIKARLKNVITESIANSFDIRMLNRLGKKIELNFDFYKISGISEKMPIQPKDAARIFIEYFIEKNEEEKLIAELLNTQLYSLDGYTVKIYNFNGIIEEIERHDYIYDKNRKKIVLLDKNNTLNNWGYLEDSVEYLFCFVSIDIVDNSKIVRKNNPQKIKETYRYFYNQLKSRVSKRDGRIWIWEGDGGIIAFHGNNAINRTIFSILDFTFSLPVLNAIYNKLNKEIKYRIAINPGNAIFKNEIEKIKSAAIDRVIEIEKKYTQPGNIVITKTALQSLNSSLQAYFKPLIEEKSNSLFYFDYQSGRKPKL